MTRSVVQVHISPPQRILIGKMADFFAEKAPGFIYAYSVEAGGFD